MGSSCSCQPQYMEAVNELNENITLTKMDACQNATGTQNNQNCISDSENTLNQMPSKFLIVYPGDHTDLAALLMQLETLNKNGEFIIKECCKCDNSQQSCSLQYSNSSE